MLGGPEPSLNFHSLAIAVARLFQVPSQNKLYRANLNVIDLLLGSVPDSGVRY